MGYSIQYSPQARSKFPVKVVRRPKAGWIIAACTTAVLVFCAAQMGWLQDLKEFFIPGDAAVTEAAFSALLEDIRDGVSIGESVTTFCQEIIRYAAPPL